LLETLAILVTSVRYLVNEATASFYSDAEIGLYLNEGQEIFSTETKCLSKYYSRTLEDSDIKHDREIRMGSDFIAFDEGGVLYNDKPLNPISLKALDEWVGSWRDTTGTPTRFYIRGDMIGFYPKPSVGDTVKYYGIERATTLSGSVVPLSGDYRVIAFRRHIRDYAVAMCWYGKHEDVRGDKWMAKFDKGLYKASAILNGEKNQPKMMIPSYRSRRHVYSIRWGDTSHFD